MKEQKNKYTFDINDPESILKAVSNFQKDNPTMNINSPKETKVIYTGKGGYESDKVTGDEFLVVGQEYTIEKTIVHSYSTDIHLKEIQNKWETGVRVMFKPSI